MSIFGNLSTSLHTYEDIAVPFPLQFSKGLFTLFLFFTFDFRWFLVSVICSDLIYELIFFYPTFDLAVGFDCVASWWNFHVVAMESYWSVI